MASQLQEGIPPSPAKEGPWTWKLEGFTGVAPDNPNQTPRPGTRGAEDGRGRKGRGGRGGGGKLLGPGSLFFWGGGGGASIGA